MVVAAAIDDDDDDDDDDHPILKSNCPFCVCVAEIIVAEYTIEIR